MVRPFKAVKGMGERAGYAKILDKEHYAIKAKHFEGFAFLYRAAAEVVNDDVAEAVSEAVGE